MLRRLLPLALTLLTLTAVLAAPPRPPARPVIPAPAPPKTYDAQVRYRLSASGSERVRQYLALMRGLKEVGFRRADEEVPEGEADEPNPKPLRGTIPARNVPRLLDLPAVRAVLLVPEGAKVPEEARRPVRVDIQLTSLLASDRQRLLHQQTADVLEDLGFREAVGYDTRDFTRLVGSFPAGRLDRLLDDLRSAVKEEKQPVPFHTVSPVRATVVRPDWPAPDPRPAPPKVPEKQRKLSPELRKALSSNAPTRMEVILAAAPAAGDTSWERALELPGLVVEGRLGPLVTVRGTPKAHALALADLPEVAAVRLPRPAESSRGPGREEKAESWDPLTASGLVKLHALGHRGRGTRLAVVADDFHGWEVLKGRKAGKVPLPDPVLVDLTRERNADLLPDAFPSASKDQPRGPGTRCALTILKTAPEVELTLIRVDPSAPYMLEQAARAINGEPLRTTSLDRRVRELNDDRNALDLRRDALAEQRRRVLDEAGTDEEPDLEKGIEEKAEKGKLSTGEVRKLPEFRKLKEAAQRRVLYRVEQQALDRDERAYKERRRRYLDFLRQLRALKGVRVVASSLVWAEGYPVDGTSTLSRYFDDRPFRAALWFQAAGDSAGQAWSGPFRDADRNGVMEFAPPGARLPRGAWTPEVNFLGWRTRGGRAERDLPAGARLRVSVQWHEAHDPVPLRVGEDPYREPLASVRLVLLQQPDPEGRKRPADDFRVVAESAGPPQRLSNSLSGATYEQVVELTVTRPGRYGVRVEGRAPESIHPPGEARLPALKKTAEMRLRLFVRTLEGAGRGVLTDFATPEGEVGMPADSRRVITVGAAGPSGKAEPFSAGGPPFGLALLSKPQVLAFDGSGGTAEAACFAAGLVATAHSAGAPLCAYRESLRVAPGGLLRIPAGWPGR
jgi:hypothetical protein